MQPAVHLTQTMTADPGAILGRVFPPNIQTVLPSDDKYTYVIQ